MENICTALLTDGQTKCWPMWRYNSCCKKTWSDVACLLSLWKKIHFNCLINIRLTLKPANKSLWVVKLFFVHLESNSLFHPILWSHTRGKIVLKMKADANTGPVLFNSHLMQPLKSLGCCLCASLNLTRPPLYTQLFLKICCTPRCWNPFEWNTVTLLDHLALGILTMFKVTTS